MIDRKKIVLLSSSRADYGIYRPLIKQLLKVENIDLNIAAFGTHLSSFHDNTIKEIFSDGVKNVYSIHSILLSDSKEAISTSMGTTLIKFSSFWANHQDTQLIIALGDRYEMFSAVSAAIPYNIKILHIHGGETTLGAIDNKFRHAITIFSEYHFTSTEIHCQKVKELKGYDKGIYNIGALSLDNLNEIVLLSKEEFKDIFDIDITIPSILITCHPETIHSERNITNIKTLIEALKKIDEYQYIITMPNADTNGQLMRQYITDFASENSKVKLVENFGTKGYFTCMHYCSFLLGNTSSGIIEAASFGKYVINIGDRQLGRSRSGNIIQVDFSRDLIIDAIRKVGIMGEYKGGNIYKLDSTSSAIRATKLINTILNE